MLVALGIQDKKGPREDTKDLHAHDIRQGQEPLDKLAEMLQDETDEGVDEDGELKYEDFKDMIEDLFENDKAAQAKFRAAVAALVSSAAESSAEAVVNQRSVRERLLDMLPKGEQEEMKAQLAEQAEKIKAQAEEMKAMDEELARLRE